MEEKTVITDKSVLFALTEPTLHYIKVAPDREEYLKVWVKEPTWLEVDRAMNSLMKIDPRTQSVDLDLNAMNKYMVENFISKTEPSLSAIDLLRLSPYVGNQLKEILPNPMDLGEEESKKDE
ncbi:MAG: hypothetical protein CL833_02795 [Crocinitomicaceae bacterium]|jgi:hypothetical protein|nr:hypothetical protein [Crocinitomicaceae bacterium]|tara:strand:- start:215 stop:580 length:366 start_codon:yes stop_codon:yes gene_type:complete